AGIDGDVFYSDDEGDNWSNIASGLPPISKGTREERHKLRKDAPERVSTR
ncbi:MAG: hypothetical protein HW416_3119, partial [Chloroflexi bacterium]|nr:hypothetical protein [Chloroflexota bacterium]